MPALIGTACLFRARAVALSKGKKIEPLASKLASVLFFCPSASLVTESR